MSESRASRYQPIAINEADRVDVYQQYAPMAEESVVMSSFSRAMDIVVGQIKTDQPELADEQVWLEVGESLLGMEFDDPYQAGYALYYARSMSQMRLVLRQGRDLPMAEYIVLGKMSAKATEARREIKKLCTQFGLSGRELLEVAAGNEDQAQKANELIASLGKVYSDISDLEAGKGKMRRKLMADESAAIDTCQKASELEACLEEGAAENIRENVEAVFKTFKGHCRVARIIKQDRLKNGKVDF